MKFLQNYGILVIPIITEKKGNNETSTLSCGNKIIFPLFYTYLQNIEIKYIT